MSLQQRRELTLLVLVLAVFAAAVINLSLFSFRLDITSSGAYSISEATKTVVGQAKEGIDVVYFLSKKLTGFAPVTQEIADFLQEYADNSNGKVKVRVIDPQETGQLGDMQRLGLQPYSMNIVEQSQQTQTVVYSGIVLQYLDRQEVLPLVGQIDTLEYDLTNKINKLITQKQKTVAFLSTDPAKNLSNTYGLLSQTLSRNSTVREVHPGEAIGDATVLIVAGEKGVTPAVLKNIDDYVMKGGKVLFAVDGVSFDLNSPQGAVAPAGDNELLKALEIWGVKVDQSLVLDAYNTVVPFSSAQGQTLRRYPLWPQILANNTSRTNAITSRFGGLTLMWPSALADLKKAGIRAEPLVWTSDKSWIVKDNMTLDPDMAARSSLMPGVKMERHNEVLALTGVFPSAFPNGGVSPSTRLVVVGSSNFLSNMMQATGRDDNAVFAENAVDWLAQDEGLLSIKTRTAREKSLTLLQDSQVRDSVAFSLSFVNLFLVPMAIIVWAVVRFLRRRAREQKS